MQKYHDFWSVLLGKQPPGFIFGYITLAYIAAIAMVMIIASTRDPNSPNSPKEWSWRFFWVNNSIRFVVGFFLIPIFIRILIEYQQGLWLLIESIGVGFGFMGLAQLAKQIGLFTTSKISARVVQQVNQEATDKKNTE